MAKDRDELLDHSYDGIREYNNPLPRWWLWLFYASILFALFYIPWHFLGYGLTGPQEYQEEVSEAAKTAPQPARRERPSRRAVHQPRARPWPRPPTRPPWRPARRFLRRTACLAMALKAKG